MSRQERQNGREGLGDREAVNDRTYSCLRWRGACSFPRRYGSSRRRYGLVRHGTGSGAPGTCYARGHLSVRGHVSTLAPLCGPGKDLPGGRASAFSVASKAAMARVTGAKLPAVSRVSERPATISSSVGGRPEVPSGDWVERRTG